jgi:hypothetical protein
MGKELEGGLTEMEIIALISKKKKRHIAVSLNDLEDLIKDKEQFKYARKILLDCMNGYTRGLYSILGISIEGVEED